MTSQYGAYALHAGLVRLHAHMRMHTSTRPGTHMHTGTRKRARTYQYIIVYLLLFHGNNGSVNAPMGSEYGVLIRTHAVLQRILLKYFVDCINITSK